MQVLFQRFSLLIVALPGFAGLKARIDGMEGVSDLYDVVVDLEGEHVLTGQVLTGALESGVLFALSYRPGLVGWRALELGLCWFFVGTVQLVAVL